MKRIDVSEKGVFDIDWSPDGKWVTYMLGDEIRIVDLETLEISIIGEGRCPHITADRSVVFERNDEILLASGGGTRTLVSKKDIVKETPKRSPFPSPDNETMVIVVCNVYDKSSQALNSFPYRHFWALSQLGRDKGILTREQWYGGAVIWFPDSTRFCHFEFDSTAGPQIHIVNKAGEREGTVAGLYASISPDGKSIASLPKGGGSIVVYTSKGGWTDDDIDASIVRIPNTSLGRPSATPPIWVDNRLLLLHEEKNIWRIDTKKDKAEEMKKIPLPTTRRQPTIVPSPSRDKLAMEVASDNGFELCVVDL